MTKHVQGEMVRPANVIGPESAMGRRSALRRRLIAIALIGGLASAGTAAAQADVRVEGAAATAFYARTLGATEQTLLRAEAERHLEALTFELRLLDLRYDRRTAPVPSDWPRWVDPLRGFGDTRVIDRPTWTVVDRPTGFFTLPPPPSAGLEPGVTLDTSRAIAAMRIDMLRYAPASTFDEAWSRAADALDDLQRQIDTTRWYTPP
jgi:hypothetical protein